MSDHVIIPRQLFSTLTYLANHTVRGISLPNDLPPDTFVKLASSIAEANLYLKEAKEGIPVPEKVIPK